MEAGNHDPERIGADGNERVRVSQRQGISEGHRSEENKP
jgi:hypothetical protein